MKERNENGKAFQQWILYRLVGIEQNTYLLTTAHSHTSRNEIHRVTDICLTLTAVDMLHVIHARRGIVHHNGHFSNIDDFMIIGECAGFARGKCCANSRVDSKIELPTSGSRYRERDAGAENANASCVHTCVYTERPAFVVVCTRETAPMNEPARVSPRDLLLST